MLPPDTLIEALLFYLCLGPKFYFYGSITVMPSGQKINSEIGVTQILALKTFVFRISDLA